MEWIKVSDRLPENEGYYLVKVRHSFPKNCKMLVAEYYNSEAFENSMDDVTHWAEITPPID